MENISLNGEEITLNPRCKYLVVDAGYLNDIARFEGQIANDLDLISLQKVIFPYTDYPFTVIQTRSDKFLVESISRSRDIDLIEEKSVLSIDTGLMMFVNIEKLPEIIKDYSYGKLVDSITDPINYDYWKMICSNLQEFDIALILSPGLGSGYEFDGGGLFVLN